MLHSYWSPYLLQDSGCKWLVVHLAQYPTVHILVQVVRVLHKYGLYFNGDTFRSLIKLAIATKQNKNYTSIWSESIFILMYMLYTTV